MPMGRRTILIDQAYMKSAGEKTAIQSSTDGLVQPYFTVTHSVSSPCQILKFEKQHVMYTVKWLCSYRIVCHIWGMIHVFSSLICQVCVDTSTYLFYNVCTKQNSSIKKSKYANVSFSVSWLAIRFWVLDSVQVLNIFISSLFLYLYLLLKRVKFPPNFFGLICWFGPFVLLTGGP